MRKTPTESTTRLDMASTPETSFSSDDLCRASRETKHPTPPGLPSPQQSDKSIPDDTHEAIEAIEQAYQTIWDSFCGLPLPDHNPTFYLRDQESYEELYHRLGKHQGLLRHFEEIIRKDWDDTGVLTLLLMSTPIHEVVTSCLESVIDQELKRVADQHPALKPFCERLVNTGHARIQHKIPHGRAPDFEKSPDGQIRWKGARHPPFIFEIAFSQDAEDLNNKVVKLFEKLPGKLCMALGIDIDYREREGRRAGFCYAARASLWTSDLDGDTITVTCLMDSRPFRDENGIALPGEVVLPFQYFMPTAERRNLPPPNPGSDIHLSFASLSETINVAMEIQNASDKSVSPVPKSQSVKRVRFVNSDGEVTGEKSLTVPKRQRVSDAETAPRTRPQTRSQTTPQSRSRTRSQTKGKKST